MIEQFETIWSGITIQISFERDWLSMTICPTAHLQIKSVSPARAPLPIAETGYRSHFLSAEAIDDLGGPVAYALAWLDAEALKPKWKAAEQARRQLSLF